MQNYSLINQVLGSYPPALRTSFSTVYVKSSCYGRAGGQGLWEKLRLTPLRRVGAMGWNGRAKKLCRRIFLFKINGLALSQGASSQFCPQKM
jgi:hypothetical protein